MQDQYDLVVIGAGPSGLNAASTAAENGLEVILVDEQEMPGGQIYRNVTSPKAPDRFLQADDRKTGQAIVARFFNSGADYLPNSLVWFAEPGRILCSCHNRTREIRGQYLVVATGAMERPVPFTGWTLPGVMGAGAGDILHKDAGLFPKGPVVIAGNGPLIPLAGSHLISGGVDVAAVIDTAPAANMIASITGLPGTLRDIPFMLKGAGMMKTLLFSKTPVIRNAKQIQALGNGRLERVKAVSAKSVREFNASTLLVHQGVIPRTHFTRMMGLAHEWDPVQRYWYPRTNARGKSSMERVYVAGDTAFVHGAQASACKGSMAGIDVALKLNMIGYDEAKSQWAGVEKEMAKALAPRRFADRWFAPAPDLYDVDDQVMVCRCEGVKAKDIREAVAQGCHQADEIKIRTRCGMGPCQGRMCGPALAEISALALDCPVPDMGALNIRPPVRPIPFAQISALAKTG
ncbi:MAG: NAD(P)/FAD-dependent oxidoreductase [Desulfobacter sp.]